MKAETWFTAQEAVDAGLVDSIATKADKKPKMQFDLSAYANAPAPKNPLVAALIEAAPVANAIAAALEPDNEIERRRQRLRLALATPA